MFKTRTTGLVAVKSIWRQFYFSNLNYVKSFKMGCLTKSEPDARLLHRFPFQADPIKVSGLDE